MMRIGLTYTGSETKHENYVRWIQDGGASIEVVRLEAGGQAYGELDGLVLSGGVDIAPEFYSGRNDYFHAPAGWERSRDLFEMEALELALQRGKPVLGVCRGLQLINVVLGGSLVQDLGEQGDAVHENVTGVDKEHRVVVEEGTVLSRVAGEREGIVNSAHHQAVDRIGADLRVNCRAEDGTIEGLEWKERRGRPWLLAVQWHPERMFVNGVGDVSLYRKIRDTFLSEAGKTGH
ncbi:MAG TPA: gamma-glutamyl-gamma-aminobutyrate hydrolase family protein [Puia sp.]|nr:gamma-glutamyl-gamma-aminobutyrate hydrolase family protein [Puia sp.]